MTNFILIFLASFAFGLLVGLGAGLSKSPGTGKAFVSGLLGTGVLSQLLVLWGTGDVESAMWGLLGFSAGGVIGLAIGLLARGGNGLQAKAQP
ncbi:MAG TPA: hypothetical protein VFA17_04655 [Thermoplasmata archaeon]|jgi:hypothetical protein|nr:hypothetical protein [Thermoplasmata archaeon]